MLRNWLLLAIAFLLFSLWILYPATVSSDFETLPANSRSGRIAFATVLGSDDYWVGVAVLRRSLQEHHEFIGHSADFIVLCTTAVSIGMQSYLRATGSVVQVVPEIPNPYDPETRFLGSFAKLYLWNLTDYDQVVYLDADCYVTAPLDGLLTCERFCMRPNHPSSPSVCPFNSGVMVLRPSANKFRALLQSLDSGLLPSDDLADQGFLNSFHYYDCMGIVPDPDTFEGDFVPQIQQAVQLAQEKGHYLPSGCASLPMLVHGKPARCQLLPYEYNFDVRSRMIWWKYWLFGLFTKPPIVAQFTGPFKPWDCGDLDLTLDQLLTCNQPLFRRYRMYY